MHKYTHAAIVPLIGGFAIGTEIAFGREPEYILSYEAFGANDSQYRAYRPHIPYKVIDKGEVDPLQLTYVDAISTVCPCAGLSSLSTSSCSDNAANDWMLETAKYVLSEIKPKVFYGENAPRLASKMGEPVAKKLRAIAAENGYTFSLYKTKSILHGLSQVRDRTFYFFWQGDQVPVLNYFNRPHETIEETIENCVLLDDDPMNVPVSKHLPSDDPFYKYLLDVVYPGKTHTEICAMLPKSTGAQLIIEGQGHKYEDIARWMRTNGYEKQALRCEAIDAKLQAGGNVMRKLLEFPRDYIGAFVAHLPTQLIHPLECRFLTIRECLEIMKMPSNFQLQGGVKNLNMICQNVPVTTATDMAREVLAVLKGDRDLISTDFLIQDNRKQEDDYSAIRNTLDEFF